MHVMCFICACACGFTRQTATCRCQESQTRGSRTITTMTTTMTTTTTTTVTLTTSNLHSNSRGHEMLRQTGGCRLLSLVPISIGTIIMTAMSSHRPLIAGHHPLCLLSLTH